jgi:hypothetical protein
MRLSVHDRRHGPDAAPLPAKEAFSPPYQLRTGVLTMSMAVLKLVGK